jgi:hypothetical protein
MAGWKWVLNDPVTDEEYVFEINANSGGSPTLQKTIQFVSPCAEDGNWVIFEGRDAVPQATYSGTLVSKAQYNALVYWFNKRVLFTLTDDLGRIQVVYFTEWTPTRKFSVNYPWLHDWQMVGYILSETVPA